MQVSNTMWVFSPVMLPPSSNDNIRKLNAELIARQIRRVLKSIDAQNWFYWITVPTASDILEKLPHCFTIFNRSDVFSKFPEAREEYVKQHEKKMNPGPVSRQSGNADPGNQWVTDHLKADGKLLMKVASKIYKGPF